jgi:hypothetical protein
VKDGMKEKLRTMLNLLKIELTKSKHSITLGNLKSFLTKHTKQWQRYFT